MPLLLLFLGHTWCDVEHTGSGLRDRSRRLNGVLGIEHRSTTCKAMCFHSTVAHTPHYIACDAFHMPRKCFSLQYISLKAMRGFIRTSIFIAYSLLLHRTLKENRFQSVTDYDVLSPWGCKHLLHGRWMGRNSVSSLKCGLYHLLKMQPWRPVVPR